jgi:crotonobetaine/carnitine-CoA ligase
VPDTIPELLITAAERDPSGVWLRTDDGELGFAATTAAVARLAARLRETGVRQGDLVVVTTRTTPPYLLTWLALACLGAITVPTDPSATEAELHGLLEQTRPRLLVSDAELLAERPGASAYADLGAADVHDLVGDWRRLGGAGDALSVAVVPDDVAVLIPTSGTTGRSKLVIQTQRAYAWAGEGFPAWVGLRSDDVVMTGLPLFHINAPAYSVLGSLWAGAGLVLLPRFSASGFLDSARRHGATEFNAIGAMLEILMRQPERDDDADTPLRLAYSGPAPDRDFHLAFERRFGLELTSGYGMSETPYGTFWRRGTRPYGTLGSLRQHPRLGTINEGRVVDDDGAEVGVGGTGELLLRNPVVTPGYWGMPEETAAAFVDGWLRTGDLVTVNDDETFTFVARKKHVIRRRGQNLSPAEVEEAICAHPSVLECAVVAVPSEFTEDEVKAFVVTVDGSTPDFPELRAWSAERLTAFKVPRFWQAVDALPRTPTQRVATHRLPTGHPPEEYDAEATA